MKKFTIIFLLSFLTLFLTGCSFSIGKVGFSKQITPSLEREAEEEPVEAEEEPVEAEEEPVEAEEEPVEAEEEPVEAEEEPVEAEEEPVEAEEEPVEAEEEPVEAEEEPVEVEEEPVEAEEEPVEAEEEPVEAEENVEEDLMHNSSPRTLAGVVEEKTMVINSIEETEKEIVSISERIDDLRAKINEVSSKEYMDSTKGNTSLLDDINEQITKKKKSRDTIREEIDSLDDSWDSLSSREEKDAVMKKMEELSDERSQLFDEIKELTKQKNEITASMKSSKKDFMADRKETLSTLRNERDKLYEKISELRAYKTELRNKKFTLSKKERELEKEEANMQEKITPESFIKDDFFKENIIDLCSTGYQETVKDIFEIGKKDVEKISNLVCSCLYSKIDVENLGIETIIDDVFKEMNATNSALECTKEAFIPMYKKLQSEGKIRKK